MAVKAPTAKRFLVFAQWYLTPVGGVYTAIVVAGIVLALADRLPAAVLLLATGLLVVLPWKLSFHESSRANLVSEQHFLTKYAAHITDQITALESQLVEIENQTTKQISELRHLLASVQSEVNARAHEARMDALGALDTARGEWGMLLDAEREQFASQLREHQAEM